MKYAIICPILDTIAVFALKGDAEEWKKIYETMHPEMTGMIVEEQKWNKEYD